MSRYIRSNIAGATYFFTVNLQLRSSRLLTEQIEKLRECVAWAKAQHPFEIDAMVIMPDHLHALWTLPPDDHDFSTRWMLIKQRFSTGLEAPRRRSNGEVTVWQRRFWEHQVRDEDDYARHVDYIHYNPVKHGYVMRAAHWPFSSLHRYVKQGRLPADWGISGAIDGRFGE
jgi:putative transposase